jgi:hypothetical protein
VVLFAVVVVIRDGGCGGRIRVSRSDGDNDADTALSDSECLAKVRSTTEKVSWIL